MIADRCACYCHADFELYPGTLLECDRESVPVSDPESIHSCVESQRETSSVRPFARKRPLSPAHQALVDAMVEQGVTYRELACRLGVSDKALYDRLRNAKRSFSFYFRQAALALGRPDLAERWAPAEGAPSMAPAGHAHPGRGGPA